MNKVHINKPDKLKRTIVFLALLMILFLGEGYAQADQVISGGNTVTSFVCANRSAYTWGAGSNTPALVNFPGNINIKQVNSGSGTTFVAIDCDGAVWAWGSNGYGQVGNGTTSAWVPDPVRVLASSGIASSNRNASGELIGASVVYGGNVNCYAILNDGKLVAWGKNDTVGANQPWEKQEGQLGDGTNVNKTSAVYVIDGTTGLPLQGVTKVFGGDNVTYALVGSTVYSWGYG